jgi:hypothetical protein
MTARSQTLLPWLLLGLVMLTGCASPAVSKLMVAQDVEYAKVFPYSVAVNARGGGDTSAMGKPQISNEAFAQAIVDSINKSGPFLKVFRGKSSDYILNVTIIKIEQPLFGLSFSVEMETVWSLVRGDSKKILMRESLKSSYTATMGDAFVAVTRLRLATEGAARENIRLGLKKLSQLKL